MTARGEAALQLAALAWVAGFAHVQATAGHWGEWPLAAAFFAGLAAAQLLLGARLWQAPSRGLLVGAAAGSLAVAALWLVTRTTGLPFGPEAGRPEAAGALDVAATGDELLLAAGALVALRRGDAALPTRFVGPCVLIASLAAVMLAGGHAHGA